MEAKIVEPVIEKDVVITMKVSEAQSVKTFIARSSKNGRRQACANADYDDDHILSLYYTLKDII